MQNLTIREYTKPFRVAMISSNTNSFGLYQMIVISKDGEAYKTHASMYNAKQRGETLNQTTRTRNNKVISTFFKGCEMTVKLPQAPKDVINELYQ